MKCSVKGIEQLSLQIGCWAVQWAEVWICVAWAGDRHISYLPLAHIYERVTLVGVTHGGVSIGFYRCTPPH